MGQDAAAAPPWREWIRKGTALSTQGRHADALPAYQRACELNPTDAIPQLYLALAWEGVYEQGDPSPQNVARMRNARAALMRALELDPANVGAMILLGRFASNEGHLEEARDWYARALKVDGRNAGLWALVGSMAFSLSFQEGQRAERLEEALRDFEQAMELAPADEDVNAWMSALLRQRAAAAPGTERALDDLRRAAQYSDRADDLRSERMQASLAVRPRHPLESDDPDAFLTSAIFWRLGPAPPPPPPPPLRWMKRLVGSGGGGVITFERVVEGAPRPIRVAPDVQAKKLIRAVDPEFEFDPEDELPVVRFVVVIGRDGRIGKRYWVGGNHWLEHVAEKALDQWAYEPTDRDGRKVEVVTEVRVRFRRSGK